MFFFVYLGNGDGAFGTNDALLTDYGTAEDASVGGAHPKDLDPGGDHVRFGSSANL